MISLDRFPYNTLSTYGYSAKSCVSGYLLDNTFFACFLINFLCAVVLVMLMHSMHKVNQRGFLARHGWLVIRFLMVLLFIPCLVGGYSDDLDTYNAYVMMWMLPIYHVFATQKILCRYTSLQQFLRASCPVLFAFVPAIVAAFAIQIGIHISDYDFAIQIVTLFVAFPLSAYAMFRWLDTDFSYELERNSLLSENIPPREPFPESYAKFSKVVLAQRFLLLVIVLLNSFFQRIDLTLLVAVAMTVFNFGFFMILLTIDVTKCEDGCGDDEIQQYVERVLDEREGHYQKEYTTLLERISTMEGHLSSAVGRLEKQTDAHSDFIHAQETAEKRRASKRVAQEVDHIICAAVNAWIVARGFCNRDINLDGMAASIGTNRTYLSHSINAHWGVNFSVFLAQLRVNEACRLMSESPQLSVATVSDLCGFGDTSAFTRCFKQIHGTTPTKWKKEHEKEEEPPVIGGVKSEPYNPFLLMWRGNEADSAPSPEEA